MLTLLREPVAKKMIGALAVLRRPACGLVSLALVMSTSACNSANEAQADAQLIEPDMTRVAVDIGRNDYRMAVKPIDYVKPLPAPSLAVQVIASAPPPPVVNDALVTTAPQAVVDEAADDPGSTPYGFAPAPLSAQASADPEEPKAAASPFSHASFPSPSLYSKGVAQP